MLERRQLDDGAGEIREMVTAEVEVTQLLQMSQLTIEIREDGNCTEEVRDT